MEKHWSSNNSEKKIFGIEIFARRLVCFERKRDIWLAHEC